MSALWGKGGRGATLALVLLFTLVAPVGAGAASKTSYTAYTSPGLLAAAKARPAKVFNVVVQGRTGRSTAQVAKAVNTQLALKRGNAKGLKRQYKSISGVSASLTGRQIVALSQLTSIRSVTRDVRLRATAYSNYQGWTQTVQANQYWAEAPSLNAPAIAIVDSGVAARSGDFGSRLVARANLCTCLDNSTPNDGRGHGTLVASLALSEGYFSGSAPNAKLVALDVLDDQGKAFTSDVIAAADWILANKQRYNIRVANFSLHGTQPTSFTFDPLDRAVEKLWFAGVVVVTAAGNYAVDGQASGVPYAPANDPFVITVGAADTNNTVSPSDDFAAPWSAYGYTADGFGKPELSAPGRYMVGYVPNNATMAKEHPERAVGGGYMWMSGTSFAAPVVSGAAAAILAKHPDWTPDQVKGALMLSAAPTAAGGNALGVGEIQMQAAAAVLDPPNPNAALNGFLKTDSATGELVFDSANWAATAQADANWAAASWSSANWAAANWSAANWAAANWAAANWAAANWSAANWAAANWAAAAWASASWSAAAWASASWAQ